MLSNPYDKISRIITRHGTYCMSAVGTSVMQYLDYKWRTRLIKYLSYVYDSAHADNVDNQWSMVTTTIE